MLLSQFGAQSRAQESVLDVRWSRKVGLSGLSSAAGNFYLSRLYLDVSSFLLPKTLLIIKNPIITNRTL